MVIGLGCRPDELALPLYSNYVWLKLSWKRLISHKRNLAAHLKMFDPSPLSLSSIPPLRLVLAATETNGASQTQHRGLGVPVVFPSMSVSRCASLLLLSSCPLPAHIIFSGNQDALVDLSHRGR